MNTLALCSSARPVLDTIDIQIFYNIYACKNIGYICLHFAKQKIRQCAFVSLCSDVGSSHVRSLQRFQCQMLYKCIFIILNLF